MSDKLYSLDEANRLLPWLRLVLAQIVKLRVDINRHKNDLLILVQQTRSNGQDSKEEDIAKVQNDIDLSQGELDQLMSELTDKDIILRDADRGLVDFLSLRNNVKVYLCWCLGEENIDFWHDVNEGFQKETIVVYVNDLVEWPFATMSRFVRK